MDRRDEIVKDVANKVQNLKWIKLVGLGNVGSGKTSIIKYFCENKFSPGYQPTIGVDYGFKIDTINKEEVRVHLWDLSGSDEYLDVRSELYGNTDGVFLVYDVTNPASFDNLSYWVDEVNKYCTNRPAMILCASKIDQSGKRQITLEKAHQWAKAHRIGYVEVSPANGENVNKMFHTLITQILVRK